MFARGTQRPATSGGGMPAQLKRAALSVLGITVGRAGARRRHPEEQPPRRAHRLGAVFPGGARRASVSYAREGATPAPQNENQEILPGVRNIAVPPKDADVTAQGLLGHTRYDRPQMTIHPSHPISPNLTATWEGDESVFAADLATEIWHKLTRSMSLSRLLLTQLAIECMCVLVYSSVLTIIAWAERSHEEGASVAAVFGQKVMLCIATIRINTDKIFGFQDGEKSSTAEIAALSIDCVVNHEELAIRVCCPRWRTISLHNISASVCAMVDGRTVPLKLLHGISTWPLWVGGAIPITLRHDVRDLESPFNPKSKFGGYDRVMSVVVHVRAEDQHGNPISHSYQYRNPNWGGLVTRLKGHTPTGGATFPRILKGAKFMDQLRTFKVENTSGEFEGVSSPPFMCVNMDSFVRIVKDEPPKEAIDGADGYDEEAQDEEAQRKREEEREQQREQDLLLEKEQREIKLNMILQILQNLESQQHTLYTYCHILYVSSQQQQQQMIKQIANSPPKQPTLASTPPLSVFSAPRLPTRMPEGRVSPNPLSPARLPGDGLGLDGRASCGSQHYSSGGNRAMERDGIRERADDLEREQKRERLSEREQGLGLSFDTSPSRRDEERGGYPGGGPPNRGRIVIDGMVVDANFLRSALTGVSAGGGTRREVAIQHQNLQTTRAGLTGGSRKAHVDGNAESIGEKPEVQSGGNAVGEPRGQRHDEKEARGFVEPSTVRSENSRRDVELGYQGSERERGGKGQLDASPRESGADKALRLAELEKEARELQGRLAEKGILVNVSPRDASNRMSQGVMPDHVQGSPHRGLIRHDPARGGVVGGGNSSLPGVLSDLERSRERGWGSESAEGGGAGWENADVLMPTPPKTARLTPLPAFGLRGRGADGEA